MRTGRAFASSRRVATAGLTTAMPGDLVAAVGRQPQREGRAHRQPADHDHVDLGPELVEDALHLAVPVGVGRGVGVLPRGAVAGQQGHLDGVPPLGQVAPPRVHGDGVARDAVARAGHRRGGRPSARVGRGPRVSRRPPGAAGWTASWAALCRNGARLTRRRSGSGRGGGKVVLLVPQVDRPRAVPPGHLPARHRGSRERPRRGPGDPRQQPPVVRRLAVHAADPAAPGHLRGQGRVLHHAGHQGLVPEEVLLRRRPGADRPRVRRRPPRARCRPRVASSRRATCSASTPRAPAPTTAGSTAARPGWRGWRSRPRCR